MSKGAIGTEETNKAQIYRDAAKLVEDRKVRDSIQGACSAIADALNPQMDRMDAFGRAKSEGSMRAFEELFKPDEPYLHRCYWGNDWAETDPERADCRVVALCFMAAMVEAGDA